MKNKFITINDRNIGPDYPPYIIAELSANHNGSIERALKSIEAAKHAGADAVKIQTYTADTITIDCESEDFMIKDGGLWDGYSLHKLYKWAETPFEWHEELFRKAREVGITIFSSPFDHSAVDLLESLSVPAYKIASFELVDIPLIRRVAQTGKPMIMSTGMADKTEISLAVKTARENGCDQLCLLHCISSYPAPIEQSNLRTITDLAERFDVVAGLSDHSEGTIVSVASVSLGASLIEKHFKLHDDEDGPDSAFSLTDKQVKILCEETNKAWQALGVSSYDRKPAEEQNLKFRRSLYFVEDIKKGEKITDRNMRSIRPGFGISPKYYDDIIGKSAVRNISRGTPVNHDLVE